MLAVGVLVPLSYGRLGRSWRHAQGLKDLARYRLVFLASQMWMLMPRTFRRLAGNMKNTRPLEEFWEKNRIKEEAQPPVNAESPLDSPSSLKFTNVKRQLANGRQRSRAVSDTAAQLDSDRTLSPFHPALSLPSFVDTFGPLIFPLHRAALLRKRILLAGHAPVEQMCDFGTFCFCESVLALT